MRLIKILWVIRFFLYSLFNNKISMYGYIGKPIYIHKLSGLIFHKKVRILPNSRFECHGDNTYIEIFDNTSIGQNFHCTSNGHLKIGKNTVISGNVCITNIDHEYSQYDVPVLDQPNIHSKTEIGSNCFIGFGVVIQAGTVLGNNCIVGANSVVRGTFPDGTVIVGSPARAVKKYNEVLDKWERLNG
jgi:acetyltransferase-like isoleucine patch superfamily enzyme